MGLKLSEGIIQTTQYRFMLKNPKNLDFGFQRKIQNFLRVYIVWPKKMAETATVSDVQILA